MIERQDRVNWSTLKHIGQSPKHYRHWLTHQREDSDAMQLGRLVHCAIYEPDRLAERYVQEPNFHRGMKDDTARAKGYDGGKDAAAKWTLENAGREIVAADLWASATAMAEAVRADPIAGAMVSGGFAEQLVEWTDPVTGIECRGRVDHVNGRLSDLKTARAVSPRWLAAEFARREYHGQLAFYAEGLALNGIDLADPPAFIVVENVAPHDVVVLQMAPQEVKAGRDLFRRYLDTLAWCRETDQWPGVAGGEIIPLGLPAWAVPDDAEPITVGGVPIF